VDKQDVADEFSGVLAEDGPDYLDYYEWWWMDQSDEHEESGSSVMQDT